MLLNLFYVQNTIEYLNIKYLYITLNIDEKAFNLIIKYNIYLANLQY